MVAPYHVQISDLLRKEIHSGRFKQGDPFTIEKQLEEMFNVSSTTARRAIQTLVQEGYLYRRVGKGAFVRRPKYEESLGAVCSDFPERNDSEFLKHIVAQLADDGSAKLSHKPIQGGVL